jgi:hypothetical protein
MELDHLTLSGLTFELRYSSAWKLYDRAGSIWTLVEAEFGSLKPLEVQPNSTRFAVNKEVDLSVQLDKAHVGWVGTKIEQKKFIAYAEFIVRLLRAELGVDAFTRLGLRPIFRKRFKSKDEVIAAFLETGLIRPFSGKNFGVEGRPAHLDFNIRTEGDTLGWQGHLFTQTKKISVERPLGDEDIPDFELEKYELILDVDYFTTAEVSFGQLRTDEWINQAMRVIRRDAGVMLRADR